MATEQDLESLRVQVRPLLHLNEPADALYVYYALYHDPKRTSLYVRHDEAGRAIGFAAVCQTGWHLFQPTVVLRSGDVGAAAAVLRDALVPGRPYYVITTPDLRDAVTQVVDIEQSQINHVYRLDLSRLRLDINVLVVVEPGLGDLPRFVIRSQGEIAAEAGLNWASSHFAEIFVRTRPESQGRGWGQAVLRACTLWVIRSARQPLYVAHEKNGASIALAQATGYVDTGVREFAGEGVCKG